MALSHLVAAAGGAGLALTASWVRRSDPVLPTEMVRLAGSTLAAPTAAAWITDLLNAAYYAKDDDERDIADLRLALDLVTTYWNAHDHRRLHARDVVRFHRALGTARLRGSGGRTGTLDRQALLSGGDRLLGDWFSDAVDDPTRRGWGIVFPTVEHRRSHDPQRRLDRARLGPLTPPRRPDAQQVWHTYPAVPVTDLQAAIDLLQAVERWPDLTSALGRFTPLRTGGLDGQTFEIEVIGLPTARTPMLLRAYVSARNVVTSTDPDALDAWVTRLRVAGASQAGDPAPIPSGATVHAAFDLVTHEGHFLGNAVNRVLLYSLDGRPYVRTTASWDPMPTELASLYHRIGREAQHAMWGMAAPQDSMLHQLAAAARGASNVEQPGARRPGGAATE